MPGPIPPYNNPPIMPDYYQPRRFVISNIIMGQTTTVVATEDMDYVIGQTVRLIIPKQFGASQINNMQGLVLSLPTSTSVVLNINSYGCDPYIAATSKQVAQIIPVGDVNTGYINANGPRNITNYIPGSFINISPN